MFKNARRKLSGWGRGLLSSLGLMAAGSAMAGGGTRYTRLRDLLPQVVQQDRLDAAKRRREVRGRKRYHNVVNAIAGYHLECNRQINLRHIHPSWPHKLVNKV